MIAYTREGKCQNCENWFETGMGGEGICFGFDEFKDTDEDDTCERFCKGRSKSLLRNNTMEELKILLSQKLTYADRF